MRVPVKLSAQSPVRKIIAAAVIALLCSALVASVTLVRGSTGTSPITKLDYVFYDWFFTLRPIEDRSASKTAIVTVDQLSLDTINEKFHYGWPWPRDLWKRVLNYLQAAGAKCVVFDVLFTEQSVYQKDLGDDRAFASALDKATVPVVLAANIDREGKPGNFAPPVSKPPTFGGVNGLTEVTVRNYRPTINGTPSLALAAVKSALPTTLPAWASDESFQLHYYGPSLDKRSGKYTFRYAPAASVIAASIDPKHDHGVSPADFKDRIVLIGSTAIGTYDLKSSPIDGLYPGVEIHATAIENLLFSQRVVPVSQPLVMLTAIVASLAAALGSLAPRQWWLKLLISICVLAAIIGGAMALFLKHDIQWLAPAGPLLAALLSGAIALGWSYFAEDKQTRFFIRALSQYTSPAVTAELRADPGKLTISVEQRELSILFSDIAGFTDFSERLGTGVGALLNYYLDEMSRPVLETDGTVDKYIGDAVMAFWNAPTRRDDHAARACKAALAMQARLNDPEVQAKLTELGVPDLVARIGINTGIVTFGNMGSTFKFNYSVIGDPVNFASRLEGQNKSYGSRIMLGEATAEIVKNDFFLRKLDVMRVKGRLTPASVYELMTEGPPTPAMQHIANEYERALSLYQKQQWDSAEAILLELLATFPDDGPSKALVGRIKKFRHDPPAADWDGVYVAKDK